MRTALSLTKEQQESFRQAFEASVRWTLATIWNNGWTMMGHEPMAQDDAADLAMAAIQEKAASIRTMTQREGKE